MIIHLSPSDGERCGIAAFASKLNDNLTESEIVNKLTDKCANNPIIVEHEYGLHKKVDWEQLLKIPSPRKVLIQHAFGASLQYKPMNDVMYSIFDKIIVLSKRCKIEACRLYPEHAGRFTVIPHYAETLDVEPIIPNVREGYTVGIHGFAFPRNGFTRLLNTYQGGAKIYMMATINTFNKTAEMETSVYIDKIRRKIWELHERLGREVVELDFDYYNTKRDIIEKLRDKCDILVHLTTPFISDYYNSSGSINVLLATGIPVATIDTMYTEAFSKDVVTKMDSVSRIFDANNLVITSTPDGIKNYHKENSAKMFANKVMALIED